MKQTSEYIDLIKTHADELRSQFGVRTLRLFGSVSRGEQHEGSDVDGKSWGQVFDSTCNIMNNYLLII